MEAKRRARAVPPPASDPLDIGAMGGDLVALAEATSGPFTPEMALIADDT